jgi:signal transduction histidine kinase
MFLALMLFPALGLVWLGWRFVETDRIEEARRIQDRRERATELVAAALQHAIAADEQRLFDPVAWPGLERSGARVVVIETHGMQTYPQTPFFYYPFRTSLPEAPVEVFRSGEDVEFRFQNYASAIEKFRRLAQSPDAGVRAGAELRLARNLKRSNETERALNVYGELARQASVAVFGIPADLVGRHARCALLDQLGRSADLRRETQQLDTDLRAGRWRLERAAYLNYSDDIAHWLGTDSEAESLAWTAVVEPLREKWKARSDAGEDSSGRELFRSGNESHAVLWRSSADRLVALIAAPPYVKKAWLPGIESVLADQGLRLTLEDPDQRGATTQFATERVVSGLPWTLMVENADPRAEAAQSAARRRLLLAGLALLLILVSAGSYFVARAVTRELALVRLQSDFVAAVSHEFRTPLTSLGQTTEILVEGRVTDPGRLKSYYDVQARATGRLQRLVESLLDFGRMEAGSKPYRMQKLDASELVRSVVEEFRLEPAAAGYTIELSLNGAAPVIDADPDALSHAIRNLLDNAVKYSADCRTVQVEVGEEGGRVAIRVRDSGIGIPRSEQKHIFQKFVRGAAAKTSGIKGTGVGLAMVEHIVRAHGGDIHVDSEPGKGSTFTLLL